jgi:hypothetical protein
MVEMGASDMEAGEWGCVGGTESDASLSFSDCCNKKKHEGSKKKLIRFEFCYKLQKLELVTSLEGLFVLRINFVNSRKEQILNS